MIDRYQKNGVQAVNPGTYAIIHHNTVNASTDAVLQAIIASNGVGVFREAAATVESNSVSNNRYTPFPLSTGIFVAEAPAGSSEIDHNNVFDNDPPLSGSSNCPTGPCNQNVWPQVYDALGRYFFIGLTADF